MKKRVTSIALTVVLCLSLMLTMTACGGTTDMAGKWVLSGMSMGGEDYLAQLKALDSTINAEELMYFDFTADGKVTMTSYGETSSGTYKLDGKNLTITIDGDPQTFTVNGKSFNMEVEGSTMTFSKK